MTDTTLSVVIPTRNGVATLPALLDSLECQQVELCTEIVVVDSGSTDGTLDLVRHRVDRVVTIPAREFDHGLTRNRGIEASRGELVVLTVQDALPASPTVLQALAAPLLSDSRVAGSFARQEPREDASALTRHYLSLWVAASETGRVVELERPGVFDSLTPMDRLTRCAFDNVCSCIRRSAWEALPFRRTPIAEDLAWGKQALLSGQRLVYVPEAVVVHSHERSVAYELARTRAVHHQLFDLFDLRTIPSILALLRSVLSTTALHLRLAGASPRGLGLAVVWPLGQYLGGRDGARARARGSAGRVST